MHAEENEEVGSSPVIRTPSFKPSIVFLKNS